MNSFDGMYVQERTTQTARRIKKAARRRVVPTKKEKRTRKLVRLVTHLSAPRPAGRRSRKRRQRCRPTIPTTLRRRQRATPQRATPRRAKRRRRARGAERTPWTSAAVGAEK